VGSSADTTAAAGAIVELLKAYHIGVQFIDHGCNTYWVETPIGIPNCGYYIAVLKFIKIKLIL
jgi:hypothetical protein